MDLLDVLSLDGSYKTCEWCASPFVPHRGGRPQQFCCPDCRARARRAAPKTTPIEKACRDCGLVKPAADFNCHSSRNDGLYAECRDCQTTARRAAAAADPEKNRRGLRERYWRDVERARTKARVYREANRDRVRAYDRRRQGARRAKKLQQLYGITQHDYDRISESQGHVCAVCRRLNIRENAGLAVDHDHSTGAVRGLLCDLCNLGIGYFKDDPERLLAAVEYLTSDQ